MAQLEFAVGRQDFTVQAWSAPSIGSAGAAPRAVRWPQELQGAERSAWHEAEAAGRAAGFEAARVEIDTRQRQLDATARRLESVLQALGRPLAQLDDALHCQIALLATTLARALVRRELRTDPSQIIGIVRDTVALLPASARGVRVLLHPDDATLVREKLNVAGPEQAWSVVDDPGLARGDCRVHTDYAVIDARVETRLKEALNVLLGDERGVQRQEEEA